MLLCLYGIGTNAGLKRISAATEGVTFAELLHVPPTILPARKPAERVGAGVECHPRHPEPGDLERGRARLRLGLQVLAPGTGTWSPNGTPATAARA